MSNALTVSKAAERIGVHPDTLRRWTDAGKVPSWTTPAGHRRYNAADLDAMIATHRHAAAIGEHALEGDVIVDADSLADAVTGHGAA